MENDDRTSQFIQVIKGKEDLELLKIFFKKGDYQQNFITALEDELGLRGYDIEDVARMNNPFKSYMKRATNEALIDIYSDHRGYTDDEVKMVEEELAKREVDLVGLRKKGMGGEKPNNIWVLYVLVLLSPLVFGLLFGSTMGYGGVAPAAIACLICCLIGLFMGLKYATSKIETDDSTRVFRYNKSARVNGWIIIALALLVILKNMLSIMSA